MNRTATSPRVHIFHPRRPEKSYAEFWATLDGKREAVVTIAMTRDELYQLAEEAVHIANLLGKLEKEGLA